MITRINILLCIIFVVVFSYYLIGKNLKSQWSIIDDHEIITNIGESFRLTPVGWWKKLQLSEAFQPGVSLRYRPIYYAFRFGEMVLWGKNPFFWFLTRFLIFVFFQVFCWLILKKYANSIVTVVFILYLLTFTFWKDTVLRLGPSETYTLIGLPIFLYAFLNIWNQKVNKIDWLLFLIGMVVCVGSKENFIFLLIPSLLLSLRLTKLKKWTIFGFVLWLLSVIFCFFVFWAFFTATQKAGSDIYSQSTSISGRLQLLTSGSKLLFSNLVVWLLPLIVLITYWITFRISKKKDILKEFFCVLIFWLGLIMIWLSQYVFYFGKWPQENRYDFPGVLVVPLMWILTYIVVKRFTVRLQFRIGSLFISVGFLFFLFYSIQRVGYTKLMAAVDENVYGSTMFTKNLNYLKEKIMASKNCQIVFISKTPYDFEPIISMDEYLVAGGIHNSYTVAPLYCEQDYSQDKFMTFLSNSICGWSSKGNFGDFTKPFNDGLTNNCCVGFGPIDDKKCAFYVDLQK